MSSLIALVDAYRDDGAVLRLPKKQVAQRIGVSEAALYRHLATLTRLGWLSLERDAAITNPAAPGYRFIQLTPKAVARFDISYVAIEVEQTVAARQRKLQNDSRRDNVGDGPRLPRRDNDTPAVACVVSSPVPAPTAARQRNLQPALKRDIQNGVSGKAPVTSPPPLPFVIPTPPPREAPIPLREWKQPSVSSKAADAAHVVKPKATPRPAVAEPESSAVDGVLKDKYRRMEIDGVGTVNCQQLFQYCWTRDLTPEQSQHIIAEEAEKKPHHRAFMTAAATGLAHRLFDAYTVRWASATGKSMTFWDNQKNLTRKKLLKAARIALEGGATADRYLDVAQDICPKAMAYPPIGYLTSKIMREALANWIAPEDRRTDWDVGGEDFASVWERSERLGTV